MADNNFGLKIGLEGEKEFKKALSEINQQFKVLGSEMKLVASQFDKNDNSVATLTARNQVLNKEIEAQKQKIETLRAALDNAAASFGENDKRTQNWQIQLNNAQAALNDMQHEVERNNAALEDADRDMDDASESADDLSESIDDAGDSAEKSEGKFGKLGTALKAVGTAMGAAVVAAGKAAYELGKSVVDAYADYEQLVGGVDTLFKESSQELQTYAANAYKTAGLSANEYMETVTGFSASLIQSLGGDTEKAVQYADMAITDMSDNANKMGTDMSSIQNAYQGFAKQNYTMLDNLKLGYGGTKTEMERLLADAEAISGVHYDISNYADVVEAIHVIQTSMDITGTTAKEAEHTISGSVNAMQAAWQNLLVGFGNANADMNLLCSNLATAFSNVIANITPVIQNIVAALPVAFDALLGSLQTLLPTILTTVTGIFSQMLNTILQLFQSMIPAVTNAIMMILQAVVENLPLLIQAGVQLITALVQGLGEALPTLIPIAVQAVVTIVQGLIENLPMILQAALQLITGLAQGLLDAIPTLIAALPSIITAIVQFIISAIPQIIDAGIQLLTSLVSALPQIISSIVAALPQIISGIVNALLQGIPQIVQAGVQLLTSLIQNLPTIITTILTAIPQIISGIVNTLANNIPQIVQAGVELLTSLITNLPQIISEIVAAMPQIISGIVSGLMSGMSSIVDVGKNIVKGLWEGIKSLSSWIWDKVSGWAGDIWDGIKSFFGIHSPSTQMAWIGEMLVKGLANSLDDNGGEAVKAATDMASDINSVMEGIAKDMNTAIPTSYDISATMDTDALRKQETGTVNLTGNNFYIRDEQDIRTLAIEIASLTKRQQVGAGLRFA